MNVNKLGIISNQNLEGRLQECVGETVSAIIGNIVGVPMDPGFNYAATFKLLGEPASENGEDPKAGMDAGVAYGALPTHDETFNAETHGELFEATFDNYAPSQQATALRYAMKGVKYLHTYDDIIDYIKATGWAVSLPMTWFQTFNVPPPGGILPEPSGTFSLHNAVVYGVTDDGFLIVEPHLGPAFGDGGYCYLGRTRFMQVSIRPALGFDPAANRMLSLLWLAASRFTYLKDYLPAIFTTMNQGILQFTTPKNAWHATRVMCDNYGLTFAQKNILCATIYQESGFINYKADGTPLKHPNIKNGVVTSIDYGIVQCNDKAHIGPGKDFPSVDWVMEHPGRMVDWMIQYYKTHGNLNAWYGYYDPYTDTYPHKKWLPLTSPMWMLSSKA